jgi:glycosyltransferase involved in cell wall biosynthesis
MQVIVTSYQRPRYLRQTVESLRQDDVRLIIVDGGSDPETQEYIQRAADVAVLLDGNPGADALKNAGIECAGEAAEVMITSDDLLFPKGYSALALGQYRRLNRFGLKWSFCACSMDYIEKWPPRPWVIHDGVEMLEVSTCQVSGAILDVGAWRKLGGFPAYGQSGQGDWAFSKRLREAGLRMCYFRQPCLQHLGANKWEDYPEYALAFERDECQWQRKAKLDGEPEP